MSVSPRKAYSRASELPLLTVLRGKRVDPPPLWLMRQAGRYLPEYRELRQAKGSFLELVYDSDAAADVTLQPLKRFPLDAAILFSDILIVPFAIGQNLSFVTGEGPRLTPPLESGDLDSLTPFLTRLEPIYETVRKVKAQLAPETALIGFAGSPWTVATYMVAGQGSRDQTETRRLAYRDPKRFQAIIDRIERVTFGYLSGQIEAGAQAVQLFDSWAGSLAPSEFERWVIAPTARLVERLAHEHPQVPVIGFPKGAGGKLGAYARETGVSAIGIDETVDPVWADRELRASFQSRATSTRWPCSPAARRCPPPPSASLTLSPGARTSSTSATASCRTRQPRMSSSSWPW